MFDKFDHAYRRWLEEPTNKSLREAYRWLLLGGCLGVIEALDWLPAIFRPVMRVLSHPVISIGLIVAFLAVFCWRVVLGVKTDGTANYWRCHKIVPSMFPTTNIIRVQKARHPSATFRRKLSRVELRAGNRAKRIQISRFGNCFWSRSVREDAKWSRLPFYRGGQCPLNQDLNRKR
jgi:hypothetical protein